MTHSKWSDIKRAKGVPDEAARKTYRVTAERDGGFWFLRVPALGVSTQARSWPEVRPMARDLIAVHLEVAEDSFDLDIDRDDDSADWP